MYPTMLEKKKANQPHAAETLDLRTLSSSHRSQKQCGIQENLNENEFSNNEFAPPKKKTEIWIRMKIHYFTKLSRRWWNYLYLKWE